MDKKLLSISAEAQFLQTHLWATHLVPWLVRRPGPGSLYRGSLDGNMVFNWLSQQSGSSPTPAPKLPLLLFDTANQGSARVDPSN